MSSEGQGTLPEQVTRWLRESQRGDDGAGGRLSSALYDELRRIAAGQMRRERADHTLQATALVNEAYLKLVVSRPSDDVADDERVHFLRCASRAMRQVLVDHAREHGAEKRGGAARAEESIDSIVAPDGTSYEVLDLNAALERLTRVDPRKARIGELFLFGGLTLDEVARSLSCSLATVKREWGLAKAWLAAQLGE